MKSKKSQGPSPVTVAGSAVFFCVVLVGAAYFFRDDSQQAGSEQSLPAASTLHTILSRCEEQSTEDAEDGGIRTRCTARKHPAFMIEVRSVGDQVEAVSMLVPMGGTTDQLLDRMGLGLELFGLMAGVEADAFLPKEYMDAIGSSETSLVFQGRVYTTQPIPNVGLVFAVIPEDAVPASKN
jgi:hypothetical protein